MLECGVRTISRQPLLYAVFYRLVFVVCPKGALRIYSVQGFFATILGSSKDHSEMHV